MRLQATLTISALLLVLGPALVACGDAAAPVPPTVSSATTAAAGGPDGRPVTAAPLVDAAGRPIPTPPLPRGVTAQMVRSGADTALAVWSQGSNIVAASYAPASGWSTPLPLEDIHGNASRPQLASNGKGVALAVWQHTVGNIQSLRFSRFDDAAWSVPDVMPGALPRPPAQARRDGDEPQLHMDAQGNAFAQWPSGFSANEVQTARYAAGHGWTRALSEPMTAAATPAGSPATSVH